MNGSKILLQIFIPQKKGFFYANIIVFFLYPTYLFVEDRAGHEYTTKIHTPNHYPREQAYVEV
jgi:hypothetical protein